MEELVYDSQYTTNKVHAAQYLAEVLMTRKYFRKGITLPPKFWSNPKFKQEFLKLVIDVNGLFRVYPEISKRTIVSALTKPSAKHISWIKHQDIDRLIQEEIEQQTKIKESLELNKAEEYADTSACKPMKEFIEKKGVLAKLKELE